MKTSVSLPLISLLVSVALTPTSHAEAQKSARVTQVVKDVKLLPANAAARSAAISDDVSRGTAVRTGTESRAELTFTDLTLTRLGANTVFSFDEGSRDLKLGSGAILVQVPVNAPAAKITTAAVTAAITGGTTLIEANKNNPIKMLVMEGTGKLCSKASGQCEEARGGEMLMADKNGNIGKPLTFNVEKVLKTSKLLVTFKPLPNLPLITNVVQQQQTTSYNSPDNGQGSSNDSISQRTAANPPPDRFICPFGH